MSARSLAGAWASLRLTLRQLGLTNGLLYILNRLLDRASAGRVRLVKYMVVAQPLGLASASGARSSGSTVLEDVDASHPWRQDFPRPQAVIAARYANGARCLAAQVKGRFAGHVWWQRARYEEDEVRCHFLMREAGISAWDFDVYVDPRYRLGRTLALLWIGAEARMRDEGVQWTFSRISEFNAESLAAHARLGATPVARALFIVAGPWQMALFNGPPFIHLSLGAGSAPTLAVSPPHPGPSRSA